jgi:hypothetical protein
MDFFVAQDPSYDSNMLPKVVFDKTAFVKFKNSGNDFNFILCDFYLCTQSHVYRGILRCEIRTTVKTERSYLLFTGSVNISFEYRTDLQIQITDPDSDSTRTFLRPFNSVFYTIDKIPSQI